MQAEPDRLAVSEVLDLKSAQMLVVNPEYQRGAVWTPAQKKKLVNSVLRGYPIPLIYLHHIRQEAGKLVSERYEVIDGQQRINALHEFKEGAFRLFDPRRIKRRRVSRTSHSCTHARGAERLLTNSQTTLRIDS